MRRVLGCGVFVLTLAAGAAAQNDLSGLPVQSFNIDMQNRIIMNTRTASNLVLPDHSYDNGAGVVVVVSQGRIASIEMRGVKATVESVSKSAGKIILRGSDLAKVSRQSEIELPGGRYLSQDPQDPQPEPQPNPQPQGFEVKDGAIALVLVPKTR